MDRGYFAVWRKIEDHPFYKEKREFSKYEAWLDILMKAQHSKKPQTVVLGMKTLTCHYGESLRSTRSWARRWRWSESKVRRFLKLLEKLNQIKPKSEGKTTRITILNYEQYDPRATQTPTQTRRRRDADAVTDKNEKNEKNVNKNPLTPLREHLENKIQEFGFTDNQTKIIEFFKYRMQMPKAGQYKSEKGINGLFRDLIGCRDTGYNIDDCLEMTMEREWKTPNPDYFAKKNNYNHNRTPQTNRSKREIANIQAGLEFINGN